MQHKTLMLAFVVSNLVSTNAIADLVTVYGKANVTVQSTDEGEGSFTETKSNASRFGVTGDYQLENGMEALYLFEWQVDLADNAGDDNIKSRNQYVGLKGAFGTVLVGRNDTHLKKSQGKVDLFSDYEGDIKSLWKGENRVGNSVTYESKSLSGFKLGATYITDDQPEGEDGVSLALSYGDANLKKTLWYAALARDTDVEGYKVTRLTFQGKLLDKLKLGAIYHTQEMSAGGNIDNGLAVSVSYWLDKVVLKAQQQRLEDDTVSSIGADYQLGNKTKVFAWVTSFNFDADDKKDKDYLAIGLEHKF